MQSNDTSEVPTSPIVSVQVSQKPVPIGQHAQISRRAVCLGVETAAFSTILPSRLLAQAQEHAPAIANQTWGGNEMNTYADDSAALFNHLDLEEPVLVGHSTGGGEVVRYLGRHGSRRIAKAVLIGAVPPIMVKTEQDLGGLPLSVLDNLREGVWVNRSQFFKDLTLPFYGYNRPNTKVCEGVREDFWRRGMQGAIKGEYDCIEALSETDFRADLVKIDVPTLILHGDDDQIVPIGDSSLLSAKLVKKAQLKIYPGLPHGMCTTHADQINHDLLRFLQQEAA